MRGELNGLYFQQVVLDPEKQFNNQNYIIKLCSENNSPKFRKNSNNNNHQSDAVILIFNHKLLIDHPN